MTDYYNVLNENFGFSDPQRWLDYARDHKFKSVAFNEIKACPFCQSEDSVKIGSFVYYSTLHSLKECLVCRLCYVNVLVDKQVRIEHFERSYKEVEYFKIERDPIFKQAVSLVLKFCPEPLVIVDIGGATGEFGMILKQNFENSTIVINDISTDSCSRVTAKGLQVRLGDISAIKDLNHCSVIFALDVLYYEPNINEALRTIYDKLEPGGVFIARMPNKYWLIKTSQYIKRMRGVFSKRALETKISHFNPEHLFLMRQKFFIFAAESIGFEKPIFVPSVLLKRKGYWLLPEFLYKISLTIFKIAQFVVGPAKFIILKKTSLKPNG